jgi:hypothetical protein
MRFQSTTTARRGVLHRIVAAATVSVAAIVPVVVLAGPAQAAVTTGAAWHMEDPASLVDSSGNGNNGTPTAITGVPGATGNGYHFNGSTSVVRVPDAPSLNPGSADFAVSMKVRASTVPSVAVGDYDLIRKGIAGTRGGEFKMEIIANPARTQGRAFCLFQGLVGTTRVTTSVKGTTNVTNGVWHSFSCVKTASTLQIVVDGVATTTTTAAVGSISNTERLTLGAKDLGGDEFLGDMDEVTITSGTAGTPDSVPPSVPTGLTAAPGTGQVALSWTASTDNVGVTGYIVRRDGTTIATPATPGYTDTAVTAGQTYGYTVEALDAAANASGQTAAVTATVPAAPAAITLRGSSTGTNTAVSTLVLPKPASTQAGDVLIASLDARGAPSVTAPAGWTLVRKDVNGTAMVKATYWHVAGAAEPAGYTWTFSAKPAAVGTVLDYAGVSTSAPVQASGATVTTTNSLSIGAPSVTTTTPNSLLLGLFGLARAGTITPPSGMAERTDVTSPAGLAFQSTGETADQLQAAAGPTGARVATSSFSGPSVGQSVVLNPGS